jgi:hypothetical protein
MNKINILNSDIKPSTKLLNKLNKEFSKAIDFQKNCDAMMEYFQGEDRVSFEDSQLAVAILINELDLEISKVKKQLKVNKIKGEK